MAEWLHLEDTVALMLSHDYKDRFKAEFYQLKDRYYKLQNMCERYAKGELDFEPDCPLELLEEQKRYMGMYMNVLKQRARIEHIDV